jgi:exodeoxyribonuclease VII large subunit
VFKNLWQFSKRNAEPQLLIKEFKPHDLQAISLYELTEHMRRITALNFPEALWVKAEIAQYAVARGNHYLNLVEKSIEEKGRITAEAEAIIWGNQFYRIKSEMEVPIEAILQEGMEVMLKVKPDFHERYGFKLIIEAIDSAYTVGRLALERQKIINELIANNLLEQNGNLYLPAVLQNIAVLSTDTAAGYQDFMDHITHNRFNYDFNITLFKMAMQGENAVGEALKNLKKIRRSAKPFDCVVIIRGGGAKLSLKAFDDYELSEAIARFPIPVVTGIGHERDESVLDMVAHTSLKTPTAVADFCVEHNFTFESELAIAGRQINDAVASRLKEGAFKVEGDLYVDQTHGIFGCQTKKGAN